MYLVGTVFLLTTHLIVALSPARGVEGRITLLCEVVLSWDIFLLWLQEVLGLLAVMCAGHLCPPDEHGNAVR